MAEWLRWYSPLESRYRQEAMSKVRQRVKKLLPILAPLAQPVPVPAMETRKTISLVRSHITDAVARQLIGDELLGLTGRRFTARETKLLACRVAGSVVVAKDGISPCILSNDGDCFECLGVVHEVFQGEPFRGEAVFILKFVVSNGPYCAEPIELQFKLSGLARWGSQFGLTSYRTKQKMTSVLQFLDVQAILRLEREGGRVQCLGVTVTDPIACYNRKLNRQRDRRFSPCPYGAEHDCLDCGVGRNQCKRSIMFKKTSFDLRSPDNAPT